MQKMVSGRSELLRSAFLANIGENYHPDQLIFIDEAAKDDRSLNRHYGYALKN
ncbi:9457_t:CDS:1, partial [Ambispora leptoticha]